MNFPKGVNKEKNNIYKIYPPYYLLDSKINKDKNWVIFWGANYKDLPDIDAKGFVSLTNQCLDYVRRECPGMRLIYKPHPAEIPEEYRALNLEGFEISDDSSVSEFYMLKNMANIKYVFSACSWASITAYKMGLNAYAFPRLFEPVVSPTTVAAWRDYFYNLPEEVLLENFDKPLRENAFISPIDDSLEDNFKKLLQGLGGKAWFIIADPGFLAMAISFVGLIKKINPRVKAGLVIVNHHRWKVMDINEVGEYFDETLTYPKLFYSLRPKKILRFIKTSLELRFSKTFSDSDMFLGFTHTNLIENALLSYFKKGKKVAVFNEKTLDFCYGDQNDLLKSYTKRKSSKIYNAMLEPFLGLHRTIYLEDPGRVINFLRYDEPVNDVYDEVYLIK